MPAETRTIHESLFDVCAVIPISFTTSSIAATENRNTDDGIGFIVPGVGSIVSPYIGIGPPVAVVAGKCSATSILAPGQVINISSFGIYLDKYVSVITETSGGIGGLIAVGIEYGVQSVSASGSVLGITEKYSVFHQSMFDVVFPITLNPFSCVSVSNPVTVETTLVLMPVVSAFPSLSCGVEVGVELQPVYIEAVGEYNASCNLEYQHFEVGSIASIGATARNVVPNDKSIQFGSLTFQCAHRDGSDKINAVTNQKLAEAGISEPRAFTRTITITAETDKVIEHDTVINLIGQRLLLRVYGLPYEDAYISNISDLQRKAGLTRFVYTVDFIHHVFTTVDSVSFAGLSLSNPARSAPDDISPSYAGKVGANFTLTNLVPSIKRTFTFECITENEAEYTALISLIALKRTLVINGKTTAGVYISKLSALQPKGGGNIYLYTVEFSSESGNKPIPVSFMGITLPNATGGAEEVEIIQSRTTIHDGRIAADVGTIPARRFAFSCMSNTEIEYNAIYSTIGLKSALNVDGKIIPKAYVSQLSNACEVGEGAVRLYTWDVEFLEETL